MIEIVLTAFFLLIILGATMTAFRSDLRQSRSALPLCSFI